MIVEASDSPSFSKFFQLPKHDYVCTGDGRELFLLGRPKQRFVRVKNLPNLSVRVSIHNEPKSAVLTEDNSADFGSTPRVDDNE